MENTVTIYRGDSVTLKLSINIFDVRAKKLKAVPISGTAVVKVRIKTSSGTQEFLCDVEDAQAGEIKCDLSSAQTTTFVKQEEQDIQIEVTDGVKVNTYLVGRSLNVRDQI